MLRAREDARAALRELRQTRHLLRQTPRVKAPRNFTLTPAMVSPAPQRPALWWRFAPALAVFLVALVVLLEFLPSLTPGASEMAAAPQGSPAVKALTVAGETPTPVILYWGGPPTVSGMGGGGASPEMGGADTRIMGGMGGGFGEASPVPAMPIPTAEMPAQQPMESPSSPPTEPPAATPEARALTVPQPQPGGETSSPILGVPEPQERGKIYIEEPSTLPALPPGPAAPSMPEILRRVIQAVLLLLALAIGVGFIQYRKKGL